MIAFCLANPISPNVLIDKIQKLIKKNIDSEEKAKNTMLIIKLSEIIDSDKEIKKISKI